MISFASWATPGNHPYLARPTLKRKHSYCNDSSSEPSPETASSELLYFAAHSRHATVDPTTPVSVRESLAPEPHDSKRRRLELERDFRQLKLEQQAREEQMQAVKARDAMYRLWEMDGEVDMDDAPPVELSGGRTWYEPEKDRIIVTSLDSDTESLNNSPSMEVQKFDELIPDPNAELVKKIVYETLKSPKRNPSSEARQWGGLAWMGHSPTDMSTRKSPDIEGVGDAMEVEEL